MAEILFVNVMSNNNTVGMIVGFVLQNERYWLHTFLWYQNIKTKHWV